MCEQTTKSDNTLQDQFAQELQQAVKQTILLKLSSIKATLHITRTLVSLFLNSIGCLILFQHLKVMLFTWLSLHVAYKLDNFVNI